MQQLARGRCFKHVENSGGRAPHPADAKYTHQTASADSVVPPPELYTLEHSLVGFARYCLQYSPSSLSPPGTAFQVETARDMKGQAWWRQGATPANRHTPSPGCFLPHFSHQLALLLWDTVSSSPWSMFSSSTKVLKLAVHHL